MPFNNFTTPAIRRDVDSYREYRWRSVEFVHARNARIQMWARENLPAEPKAR
jgi:hypothetical protein